MRQLSILALKCCFLNPALYIKQVARNRTMGQKMDYPMLPFILLASAVTKRASYESYMRTMRYPGRRVHKKITCHCRNEASSFVFVSLSSHSCRLEVLALWRVNRFFFRYHKLRFANFTLNLQNIFVLQSSAIWS